VERTYPILEMLQKAVYENSLSVTQEQARLLRSYEKCRTEELGRQVFHCDNCDTTIVAYNPCNKRGCPKCSQKNQIAWFHHTNERILHTDHHHLVFSIPESYTLEWFKDKKSIINDLFNSTSYVIKKLEKTSGLRLGWVSVFQSHAKGLSYKPHIHCALTAGGLDETGTWKQIGPLPLAIMKTQFEKRFRKIRKLAPAATIKGYWSIHIRTHEKTPLAILGYLSQNINCVSTNFDTALDDEGSTLINLKKKKSGTIKKTQIGEMLFLERYLNHIPPQGSVIVRYFGLYSNKHREELNAVREQVEKEKRPIPPKYYQECPNCKKEMRLVLIEWNVSGRNEERFKPPPGPLPTRIA